MTAIITRLPTAARNYIQVRKAGRHWCIDLVTPCEGSRPLRTTLARSSDLSSAVEYATTTANAMQRPLRLPKQGARSTVAV